MHLPDTLKSSVTIMIAHRFGQAIDEGELEEFDVSDCAQDICSVIETIKTYEQLDAFLLKLSGNWPFFIDIHNFVKQKINQSQSVDQLFVGRGKAL